MACAGSMTGSHPRSGDLWHEGPLIVSDLSGVPEARGGRGVGVAVGSLVGGEKMVILVDKMFYYCRTTIERE